MESNHNLHKDQDLIMGYIYDIVVMVYIAPSNLDLQVLGGWSSIWDDHKP